MAPSVAAEECRFRGEPAVELVAGDLSARFVPGIGMTGVSLRHRGAEHLALPGGLDALRQGHTGGLPLLAPWANRLSQQRYRAGGIAVDLTSTDLTRDEHGLPIHGLLVGQPGWTVEQLTTRGRVARLRAAIAVDAPAFPFPHRIAVTVSLRDSELQIDTTVVPTARRRVPLAFGWHPFLRLPGTRRSQWELRLPVREHLTLDDHGIPTGASTRESREVAPIGRRTFDDGYRFVRERRLSIADDQGAVELRCGADYPCAQVWVPPGRQFVALEPMTVPTNALVEQTCPLVEPGDEFTATFALAFDRPG